MIQDKPEPFRLLPCISDGCKSRKKKHSINAFQKGLLRSSLKFSEVLCFSLIFSLRIIAFFHRGTKSDRYLNKNQVSVAIRRYKSLSGKHQSLSSSSPYYNICKTFCIRTLLSQSAYPCVSILHGHFLCFVAAAPCPPFSVCLVSCRFPARQIALPVSPLLYAPAILHLLPVQDAQNGRVPSEILLLQLHWLH